MIVDTFMFFNELDILEVRLRELDDVVDAFVLLECTQALSSIKKPLFFEENKSRFSQFLPRIHHVILPGLPPLVQDSEQNRFWLERFQRDAIMLGLVGRGLHNDDIILLSDVDEIPSANAVLQAASEIQDDQVWVFKQKLYCRYLDTPPPRPADHWLGTVAVQYSVFAKILPQDLRWRWAKAGQYWTPEHDADPSRRFIDQGGWHLTYFGSRAAYDYKTANFAHGANGGAGGTYGNPNSVPPAAISREETSGVKPFDESMQEFLLGYISQVLLGDVPHCIRADLASFYHLFECSQYQGFGGQ